MDWCLFLEVRLCVSHAPISFYDGREKVLQKFLARFTGDEVLHSRISYILRSMVTQKAGKTILQCFFIL